MPDATSTPIFVTGGTGFIGSHVLRHLKRSGYQNIRAIHRPDSSFARVQDLKNQIDWVEGDLLDLVFLEEALEGCKAIIHCAGLVSYQQKDRDQLELANVQATEGLVNLALHHNIQHFIHLSSTAALGRDRQGEVIHEKSKWENNGLNTQYAISKFRGEQEVWRGAAEGLPVSVLHPSMVLGNLDWQGGIGRMFEEIWQGLRYYPSGGNGLVSVKDVVIAIDKILGRPAKNERYILSAANYTYQQLFSEIANALDKKEPSQLLSRWKARLYRYYRKGLNYFQQQSTVLTKDNMLNMLHLATFDNTKSRTDLELDYRAPIDDIKEMANSFLQKKKVQ